VKLVLEKLTVARGSRTVISNLSLEVASGDAVLLTGANGSGKTTLIRSIAGLIAPLSGRIALEGGDSDRDLAQQCHYAGHTNAIKANLTVSENLEFWQSYLNGGAASGDAHGDLVGQVLTLLNLESLASIPTAYLSAGQKRRVGLARILMAKRPVWLLDEPTVSLDTASVDVISKLINTHTAGGGLALIATHLPLALTSPRTLHLTPASGAEAA
jgi:heme exporter protein A